MHLRVLSLVASFVSDRTDRSAYLQLILETATNISKTSLAISAALSSGKVLTVASMLPSFPTAGSPVTSPIS